MGKENIEENPNIGVERGIHSQLDRLDPERRRSLVGELFLSEFDGTLSPSGLETIRRIIARPTREEMDSVAVNIWNDQRAEAITLLSKFEQVSQKAETLAGINHGVLLLVKDILQHYIKRRYELTGQPFNLEETKRIIDSILGSFLPEEKPPGILLRNGQLQRVYTRSGKIMPRGVSFLLQRYGLADGRQKSMQNVGEIYGVSPGVVDSTVYTARNYLAQNKELKILLFGTATPRKLTWQEYEARD